eukprot:XP_011424869.1 PREDICTED: uncharacterized protein LOC105326498 isoform X2 [Crassostrea gigas]
MPKVKKSKRIAERRESPTENHQQSKEKRRQSVNTDTLVTVEKSPEVDHVVGNTKHCPESGAATNAAKLGLSDDEICKAEIEAWFVVSSIVKKAFVAARDSPGGVSLGPQRLGINMWWQGKGGMIWTDMYKKIKTLLKVNDKPQYLIMHCAANDMGKTKLKELIENVNTTLGKIQLLLPDTNIIWSQLLPRRKWRYSEDVNAMNKSLIRLKCSIAAKLVRNGGGYIEYPDIKPNDELLFDRDGVHLSEKGTEIFLNTICAAIEQFSKTGILVYPKLY